MDRGEEVSATSSSFSSNEERVGNPRAGISQDPTTLTRAILPWVAAWRVGRGEAVRQ